MCQEFFIYQEHTVNKKSSFLRVRPQVVQRIKAVEHETRLLVVDRETDEYFRSLRLTCTEEMAIRTNPAAPSPSTSKQGNGSVSKRPEISKPIRKAPSRATKKVCVSSCLYSQHADILYRSNGLIRMS